MMARLIAMRRHAYVCTGELTGPRQHPDLCAAVFKCQLCAAHVEVSDREVMRTHEANEGVMISAVDARS